MLISLVTKERVEDHQLYQLYPNVSFAETLSDAALEGFPYKVLRQTEQPLVESHQKVIDAGSEEIDGKWYYVWQVVDKTPDELYAENSRVWEIQARLDTITTQTLKPLRQVAIGLGDNGSLQELTDLNTEFEALTAELEALQPV